MTQARESLRTILAQDVCEMASSVFDAMSARVAQSIGARVGILGGSAASAVILGAPDIVLITASELVEQTRRICRTNCVDLIVDGDHGYGNALNVMRTVAELQAAGAAAVCLEDTALPAGFNQGDEPELLSLEEGERKMAAALQARGDGPMLILGRTNAVRSHDVKEAVRRLQAYEKAGVDALFVPYLHTRDELTQIASQVSLPIVTAGSDPTLFDQEFLRQSRVKVWMWGHQPLMIAYRALAEAMQAARKGIAPEQLPGARAPDVNDIVMDTQQYDQLMKDFLSSGK